MRSAIPEGVLDDAATVSEEERLKQQAAFEEAKMTDAVKSEEEALRLSASLREGNKEKPKVTEIRVTHESPSKTWRTTKDLTQLGVTGVVPLGGKIVKQGGYGLSAFFAGIEKAGQQALKKFGWLKWVPFLGNWLTKEPEKTWKEKEQDEEAAKKAEKEAEKKAAEAKRTAATKKRAKDLQQAGLSEDVANAILGTAGAEGESAGGSAGPKPEDKAKEEKAA